MSETYISGSLAGTGSCHIRANLLRSAATPQKAVMLCRFIEDWCSSQCVGEWRVECSVPSLDIIFSVDRDNVLFRLTPEWDCLHGNYPITNS